MAGIEFEVDALEQQLFGSGDARVDCDHRNVILALGPDIGDQVLTEDSQVVLEVIQLVRRQRLRRSLVADDAKKMWTPAT